MSICRSGGKGFSFVMMANVAYMERSVCESHEKK